MEIYEPFLSFEIVYLTVYLMKKYPARRESTNCTQCLLCGGRAACVRLKIKFLLIILHVFVSILFIIFKL